MLLTQYYLGCLAQASYLIGDEESGTAIVVDPRRDIAGYLENAEARGLRITHTILTHFHADFVAGHIELRDRFGAHIMLGAHAVADYEFTPLADGESFEMGRTRLQFLGTPGHTPEAISILLFDLAADPDTPHAVLTGDTLFIGDVGRPDLMASEGVTADELARALYHSLQEKILPLPDGTLVYPGHGAGSLCGRSLSSDTVSTIGEQRRYNYALQPMDEEAFVRLVTTDQPPMPDYFAYDAALNRRDRPTLDSALARELRELLLEEILDLAADGAQILDTRESGAFAAAHLRGSVNIGLGGQYASWAGTLLDNSRSIVVIAEPPQEVAATVRLGRIGLDTVAGYLAGGMAALERRADLIDHFDRLARATLAEQLRGAEPPLVVDVRQDSERAEGRIDGSRHFPLDSLLASKDDLPREARIVVYCAGGYRSAIAASILRRAGFAAVTDLAGGFAAWEAAVPA